MKIENLEVEYNETVKKRENYSGNELKDLVELYEEEVLAQKKILYAYKETIEKKDYGTKRAE